MAFDENSGTPFTMPVAPVGNGGFGGGFGGDWGWIILLLVLCGGGWGMGGFGGGWGGMMGLGYDFPWLLNGQNQINANTNAGFDHAATQSALGNLSNAVTSGFGDVQTSLCSGFAGVNATVNNGVNTLAQQMYTNQISDLERSFAAQTANTAGMTALQAQLAQCCCDNRAASADLKYTLATEACATRANETANTQAILDKLCALELDGYKRENDALRTQLNMANLAASQNAQTATIQAGQRALANEVEQYVLPTPRPAYIVQNPNCCTSFNGVGCGNNGFIG